MDSLTQLRLTRELIDIDSTTGQEAAAGEFIAHTLEEFGWDVTRQPVIGDRFNVIASLDDEATAIATSGTRPTASTGNRCSRSSPTGRRAA